MAVDILLTIICTSIIQSIFGVGVLLFGTPIMLLLGYDFINTLITLLPIAIAINIFQIAKHHSHIDRDFFRNILIYSIPCIVLALFFVTSSKINIGIVIGLFLLVVAVKDRFQQVEKRLERFVDRFEKPYFVVMGIIHGLTNLGGSLLTAIVHQKNYPKDMTRVTVAISYATFALFQIVTLLFSVAPDAVSVSFTDNAIFLVVGVWVYILMEEMVYGKIDNEKYAGIFALLLFASGLMLIAKSL